MRAGLWILSLILVNFIYESRQAGHRLNQFCYFTNWSNKLQNPAGNFDVKDIDVTLCTHIIYAFAKINTDRLRIERSETDDDNGSLYDPKGRYFDINKLKDTRPHLKTLLSIGGAAAQSVPFLKIVKTVDSMRTFTRNVIIYLRDRNFDGIDVDWEYPGEMGLKKDFTKLMQIMRAEFNEEARRKGKDPLLLTAAVMVGADKINSSYEIPVISSVVDYLNVMTYDFHGTWSKVTSFSGPLYSRASNIQFNQELSQAWAIQRWIAAGAAPEKLIMGVTAAATTFTLYNLTSNFTGVGAKAERPGRAGPYIKQEGHVTYYRICELIKSGAEEHWDDEQKMAYTSVGDQWYGFGNQRSMKEKVDFAYRMRLGGMMFWSMDLDDFHGNYCNKGPYPLLTAIYNAIDSGDPTKTSPGFVPSTTQNDFNLYHRTNKNGINFFDMVNSDSRLKCCWTLTLCILDLFFSLLP